ncbi:hypothetical protein [Algoriphagus resistens]|uniref:hypothetical protein n=1 Tax=Algoriphagus resistens TaxID=1750590 RepID=UPI000716BEF9|nr:hypothetical protein [Algoriphagus resistens]
MLKRTVFIFMLVLGVALAGCSRDDDSPSANRNTYKVTMTISDVEETDFISLTLTGVNLDGSAGNTLWKINGQEMTGETVVSLARADFVESTLTYTIESIKPLDQLLVGVQLLNFNNDLSFILKIEKNGQIEIDEEKTLADGNDFTKQYTF